jgi:hypothetical protein
MSQKVNGKLRLSAVLKHNKVKFTQGNEWINKPQETSMNCKERLSLHRLNYPDSHKGKAIPVASREGP